jgi:uncharacterized protein
VLIDRTDRDEGLQRYAPDMTSIDLRSLRLRLGEVRHQSIDVDLDPFVLGGQRYEPVPHRIPVELEISEISGGTIFRLSFEVKLSGPCMRCLGHAEVAPHITAREFHDPAAAPADELRSDYVADDQLDLSVWAREAIANELPEQILCRPECAGLCPICGKDLNVEPHEHAEQRLDPRWAALEQLRDQL